MAAPLLLAGELWTAFGSHEPWEPRDDMPLVLLMIGLWFFHGGIPPAEAAAQPIYSGEGMSSSLAVSVSPMNFGDITSAGTFEGTATILIQASPGASYRIALGGGVSYSAGWRNVRKLGGADLIPYQLSADAGGAQPWGDSDFDNTFPLGSSMAVQGTGSDQRVLVFGQLVVRTLPPPGPYADSVLVTVWY
jgi:spore coat protein U-like protein